MSELDKLSIPENSKTQIRILVNEVIDMSREGMVREQFYECKDNHILRLKKEIKEIRQEKNEFKTCLTLLKQQL
ncbi:unnamed protein product [marine sediment metagenome]|uniref:Uncharacterized protein n=1 Tax=marine sediment metagenome TaxID=412755 RepID=X1DJN0_9ZZZZ